MHFFRFSLYLSRPFTCDEILRLSLEILSFAKLQAIYQFHFTIVEIVGEITQSDDYWDNYQDREPLVDF